MESRLTCILVGPSKAGKTNFINRCSSGKFSSEYSPTVEMEKYTLQFPTNRGLISMDVLDIAEDAYHIKQYYGNADCAIVMYDGTDQRSFKSVDKYITDINQMSGDIPIVICVNKCDIKISAIYSVRKYRQYSTSGKTLYNLDRPFLLLLRLLTQDPDLEIIHR